MDLFDYMNIAIALPKVFIEIIPDNNYFGIAYSLKKFASIKNVSSYIEHGYFVGSYVPKVEEYTFAKSIITFSKHRKKYIEEAGIKKVVVPIGPYIYYADDYLSDEEFSQKKKMLGKTLLFFQYIRGLVLNLIIVLIISVIDYLPIGKIIILLLYAYFGQIFKDLK